MDLLALAAAVTVMGAIIAGLLAVYGATASPRSNMERRLGNLLGESVGFDVVAPTSDALRQKRQGLPLISSLTNGRVWAEDIAGRLERADVSLTVSEFVALRIFAALLAGAIPLLLLGGILGLILGLGLAFCGYLLPNIYVGRAQSKRIHKIEEQLVEMLSMLANSLKAGFGLMQAMDLASKELEHPIATEIRRTLHDINVGSSTEEALQAFAKRCGSSDLDIVMTAMLIQQSTGGNLAEILENVGHTMRERIRIRGEIKTLTTQQMMTGYVIGGLPMVIGAFIWVLNPTYMAPLFKETAGFVMIGGAFLLEVFGMILIKRILAIEV